MEKNIINYALGLAFMALIAHVVVCLIVGEFALAGRSAGLLLFVVLFNAVI